MCTKPTSAPSDQTSRRASASCVASTSDTRRWPRARTLALEMRACVTVSVLTSVRVESKTVVKPHYTCAIHKDYKEYQEHLLNYKEYQ